MADTIPLRPNTGFPLEPFTIPEPNHIRPRPWLFGYWLMRGAVTLIAAPGGTGKTSLLTAMILSCATGRDLLNVKPHRKMKVAVLGLEEGREEMERRVAAAMLHYTVTAQEIAGQILFLDGKEYQFQAAYLDQQGQTIMSQDMTTLAGELMANGIDILFADPLALAHSAPENDNNAMAAVISYFSATGQACNAAVGLFHHTRKGAVAGDPDSIRGAGALVNHARIALGLAPMAEDEAQVFNLTPDERKRLVRVDDLKMNYSAKLGDARWIKLESVRLGNGNVDYPLGDTIQVATAWDAPEAMDGLTIDIANQILDEIEAGKDGERYSVQRNSTLPAHKLAQEVLAQHGVDKNDGWCRKLIGSWVKNLVVVEQEYRSEAQRKTRKGLFVNNSNRPGSKHA